MVTSPAIIVTGCEGNQAAIVEEGAVALVVEILEWQRCDEEGVVRGFEIRGCTLLTAVCRGSAANTAVVVAAGGKTWMEMALASELHRGDADMVAALEDMSRVTGFNANPF